MLPRLWAGVGLAVGVALVAGAVLTFGAYALTFQVQEIIGGTLSLAAVAMVTWMVLWMQRTAKNLKASLEGEVDRALAFGGLWTIVFLGFLSAGGRATRRPCCCGRWCSPSVRHRRCCWAPSSAS